jgi:hypothetical protein
MPQDAHAGLRRCCGTVQAGPPVFDVPDMAQKYFLAFLAVLPYLRRWPGNYRDAPASVLSALMARVESAVAERIARCGIASADSPARRISPRARSGEQQCRNDRHGTRITITCRVPVRARNLIAARLASGVMATITEATARAAVLAPAADTTRGHASGELGWFMAHVQVPSAALLHAPAPDIATARHMSSFWAGPMTVDLGPVAPDVGAILGFSASNHGTAAKDDRIPDGPAGEDPPRD